MGATVISRYAVYRFDVQKPYRGRRKYISVVVVARLAWVLYANNRTLVAGLC